MARPSKRRLPDLALDEEEALAILENELGLAPVFEGPNGVLVSLGELFKRHGARLFEMDERQVADAVEEMLQRPGGQADPGLPAPPAEWPHAMAFRPKPEALQGILDSEFTAAQLRELAAFLGVKPKSTLKSAVAGQIIVALESRSARMATDPDALLEGLSAEQAGFMRRLFTAWDAELPFPRSLARALLGASDDKRVSEMIEALRRRALVFPARAYQYMVSVRDSYYQLLPLGDSAARTPVLRWGERVLRERPAGPPQPAPGRLLDGLDGLMNAIYATGAEVRRGPRPHARAAELPWLIGWDHDAEEAERIMHSRPGWVPDPRSGISVPMASSLPPGSAQMLENQTGLGAAQCEWLFELAAALKLIEAPGPAAHATGGARVGVVREAHEQWLALDPAERLRRAWRAWTEDMHGQFEVLQAIRAGGAADFRIVRAIGARDLVHTQISAEWCALRRFAARALRGVDAGRWVDWAALRRELFALRPGCAHTLRAVDEWWFAAPGGQRLNEARPDDWLRTTGAIIAAIIGDSLRWFGAVDTVRDQAGDLLGLQVTELGAWLLGSQLGPLPESAAPQAREVEPVAWLDDVTWRVPPAPSRAEFIALSRQIGESAGAPFTYRLTTHSVEHALSRGVSTELAAAQFEQAGAPLPAAARTLIGELTRHFGRLRVYDGLTVIELGDDLALRELLASTSLARHLIYTLSPRAVVIRDESAPAWIEEIIARGYTPAVVEE